MDPRRTTPNPDEPRVASQSFGTPLKNARENRGMSLEQISRLTNLRPNLLEAIEASDLSKLPESIYTRSYLSNYAGVLGIDPNPIVEAYDRNTVMLTPGAGFSAQAHKITTRPNPKSVQNSLSNKPSSKTNNFLPAILGALALAVVGAGGYWFLNKSKQTPTPVVTVPAVPTPAPQAAQNVLLSVISKPAGAVVLVDRFRIGVTPMTNVPVAVGSGRELRLQLPGFEDGIKILDINQARNLSFVLQKTKVKTTTDATTTTPVAAAGDVGLRFTGQSWLRVADKTGRVLYQGIPATGSSLTYKGGIFIRAGNPSAIVVSIGGKERGPLGANSTPLNTKLP